MVPFCMTCGASGVFSFTFRIRLSGPGINVWISFVAMGESSAISIIFSILATFSNSDFVWERCFNSYIFSMALGLVAIHPMPNTVSVGNIRTFPDCNISIAVFIPCSLDCKIIFCFLLFLDYLYL